MKQISINKIRNIFSSCSKWTTSQQCRGTLSETGVVGGGRFSLSSSSSRRMGFSAEPPISQSSIAVGEKGVSMPGLKTASTSSWEFSHYNSTSSRSADTWYPLVSISCAPTLESTSFLFSCVPCWLGVTGTRARWLLKNSCLWDNNKLPEEFLGRDLLQSELLNHVQNRETTQYRRWRLRILCCFNVNRKCIKSECQWSFG